MMKEARAHYHVPVTAFFLMLAAGVYALVTPHISQATAVTSPNGFTIVETSGLQEDPETPVNLSRSGGALQPTMVLVETGVVHAIWQEAAVDSFVYSRRDGDWSEPQIVELPFGSRVHYPDLLDDDPTPLFTPRLIAEGADRIHAFWIDDEQNLYRSSVASSEFDSFDNWTQRQLLARSVVDFDVTVDGSQTLHVAYGHSRDEENQPSGLLYLQSTDGGANWSAPAILSQSDYFRTLPASELSISITTSTSAEQTDIFVAWDNRILDRVFLVRSLDGSVSWSKETSIDTREEDDLPDAPGPAEIIVKSHGEQLHLLWRADHDAQGCTLYHQWSNDAGATWQSRQALPIESPACPIRTQMLTDRTELLFVITAFDVGGYLLAWNGERWSEPQFEPIITGFVDANTNRRIQFLWMDAKVDDDGRLLIMGTDEGPNSDVWVIARPLGDAEDWFPPPSPWSKPLVVSNTGARPHSLQLIGDGSRFHAFWIQPTSTTGEDSAIYYASLDDAIWTRAVPILAPPEGPVRNLSVALSQDGRVFAVWQASSGPLYFSQVLLEEASFAQGWSVPAPVGTATGARSPHIIAIPGGALHIAYSITLNEQRGIYLIHSTDQGASWSAPVQIFDAATPAWDMVDNPRLAISNGDVMHILWTRHALPPDATPVSLHYARSDDGGQTWSNAATVDEGNIDWATLLTAGNGVTHRLWRVASGDRAGFWNDFSFNAGQTWDLAQQLPAQIELTGAPTASIDQEGRTHVITVAADGLQHLWHERDSWDLGERLPFADGQNERLIQGDIAAVTAIDGQGRLGVLYAGQVDNSPEDLPAYQIFNTLQEVRLSEDTNVAPPTGTPPTDAPPAPADPAATATSTPASSPTPLSLDSASGSNSSPAIPVSNSNSPLVSIVAGIVTVLLVIVVAVFVGLRRR